MTESRLVWALIFLVTCLLPGHSESSDQRAGNGRRVGTDSIPPDGTFAMDNTLSPTVRASIHRSAKRMGSYQENLPSQLLIPGLYGADELPRGAEGRWYAMTIAGARVSMAPVRVHLRKAPNVRKTGDPNMPGAWVDANSQDSVLFMVRKGPWERRGRFPTWFLGHARFSPGKKLPLPSPLSKRWSIIASKARSFPQNGGWAYEIIVRDGATLRSQVLGSWMLGVSPEIQWIGDLDGDGRLDIFVSDDSSETGSRSWTLYLSTKSKGRQVFGTAASFKTPGC